MLDVVDILQLHHIQRTSVAGGQSIQQSMGSAELNAHTAFMGRPLDYTHGFTALSLLFIEQDSL